MQIITPNELMEGDRHVENQDEEGKDEHDAAAHEESKFVKFEEFTYISDNKDHQ